ncbi:hypothetical protein NDU88_006168 [Pleurodeles waltl]|uniref:Uncharacterized protein n=1 Tax=Pleurodeles waltl TaxID=8319 RepID=A0AAV7PQM7_PLEWA|nr:hypothetical protein NDU88_006168 [Pleurodeles waltl]
MWETLRGEEELRDGYSPGLLEPPAQYATWAHVAHNAPRVQRTVEAGDILGRVQEGKPSGHKGLQEVYGDMVAGAQDPQVSERCMQDMEGQEVEQGNQQEDLRNRQKFSTGGQQ